MCHVEQVQGFAPALDLVHLVHLVPLLENSSRGKLLPLLWTWCTWCTWCICSHQNLTVHRNDVSERGMGTRKLRDVVLCNGICLGLTQTYHVIPEEN